jgi:hypothetical protein
MLPNPIATVDHLLGNGIHGTLILTVLGAGSVLAILLNLRAMRRGIAEVVFADIKPQGVADSNRHGHGELRTSST